MAVSNVTPSIQYTGNGNNTDFAFTFVVPALQTGNTITDATASITSGSTTLSTSTSNFFYTSSLQGKSITVNGAGTGGANLETTINTRTSGTVVELVDAANTTVSNATITVTTGLFGTAMKDTGDIEVFVDGVKQTITTHYTVLLNVGDESNKGGTVQFVTAPANTSVVTIIRDVGLERTTDFQRGGALTSKDLNAEFDNIVMALQDNIESAESNALKFPADELVSTADSTLPAKSSRVNKLLAFDANGTLNLTSDITSGDGNVSANVVTANTATFTNLTVNTSLNATVTGTVCSISNHTTDNLTEGSNNLYHTNTRVNSLFDTRLATKDTGDLTEGSNLYYTATRDTAQFNTDLATKTTDDLTEGNNLYYTTARSNTDFDARLNNKTTDNLTEGLFNLYFTDTRADLRISNASVGALSDVVTTGLSSSSGAGNVLAWNQTNQRFEPTPTSISISAQDPLNYNSGTGQLSLVTDGVDATHIDFGTGTNQVSTDVLLEGSNNLYFTNERVDDRVQGLLVNGTGITRNYDDNLNTLTLSVDSTVLRQDNNIAVSNKTIDLANNTITGTVSQFNTALSDGVFATISGTETLTNKTLTSPTINSATIDLGANLDVKNSEIVSTTGGIVLTPAGANKVKIDNHFFPNADGTADQILKTDGAGNLLFATIGTGGLGNLSEDTTPQLGADLDMNGNSIVTTNNGNINLTPNGLGTTRVTNFFAENDIDIHSRKIKSTNLGGHVDFAGSINIGGTGTLGGGSAYGIFNPVAIYAGQHGDSKKILSFGVETGAGDSPTSDDFVHINASTSTTVPTITAASDTNTNVNLKLTGKGTGVVDIPNLTTSNLSVTGGSFPNLSGVGATDGTFTNLSATNITNNRPHFNPQTTDISNINVGYGNAPIISAEADVRGGLTLQQQSARNDDGSGNRLTPHPTETGTVSYTGFDKDNYNVVRFMRTGHDSGYTSNLVADTVIGGLSAHGYVDNTNVSGGVGGYSNGDAAVNFVTAEDWSQTIASGDGLDKILKTGTKIEFEATAAGNTTSWRSGGIGNFRDLVLTVHGDKIEAHKPFALKQYATGSLPSASDFKGAIVYDSTTNGFKISNGTSWASPSGGLTTIQGDTLPLLGGNLNVNNFEIISPTNNDITINPAGTGRIKLSNNFFPTADGTNGQALVTNGSGQLSFSTISAGLTDIVSDTTPQLGGNLDVNGNSIVTASNGNISLTPNGTGEVRLDTDITELHSTKGLIIHDGAQGTYLDLTGGGGANHSALYGAGVHVEETNGGAQLSLFSHKSNGATAYPNLWAHRSRDNSGSKDFLDDNDIVFSFFGAAYDGNTGGGEGTFRKTASVELKAAENHSSSAGGGKIEFHTVDNGTMSYAGTKRLTIDDNIELNTPLDVNGQTILSSSNGNITIEPNGSGVTNMKNVRLGQGDGGIAIRSNQFADMADFVRESNSHYSYSLQVASDSTSSALAAGNAGGAFGFTAMSDSYSPNNNQFYIGSINGVIGDTGSLDGSTGGENNNAIRMYTYSDNVSYGLNNVGEFRHGTTKLLNEKLKFEFGSNTVSIDSTDSSGELAFKTNGTERMRIDGNGHLIPEADNTYDLGSTSKQFRNIYTGDMHLNNERHAEGNAVDGTKGNWTIQEGAEDLFLLNNNTGKKYKFALKEIE